MVKRVTEGPLEGQEGPQEASAEAPAAPSRRRGRGIPVPASRLPEVSGIVKSAAAVAEAFDLAPQTVYYWRKRGMPGEAGRYDLAKIRAWRETLPDRRDEAKGKKVGSGERAVQDAATAVLRSHQARLAEIKVEEAEGKLISRSLAESQILRLCEVFKSRLLGLVGTLAAQVEGLDLAARGAEIRGRFEEILATIAEAAAEAIGEEEAAAGRKEREPERPRRSRKARK